MDQKRLTNGMKPAFSIVKWACLAACCASLFVGGCAKESPEERNSYGHDGYMGYSNSNPNGINRHSTRSYTEDRQHIRQVLEPFEGIRDVKIAFNGNRASVILTPVSGMSEEEQDWLYNNALETVRLNMPDYTVSVEMVQR